MKYLNIFIKELRCYGRINLCILFFGHIESLLWQFSLILACNKNQTFILRCHSFILFLCVRYFEGGVSSVYLWDLDHGFAGVILIKKAGDGSRKIKGCWDSIHVVEVQVSASGQIVVECYRSRDAICTVIGNSFQRI